MGSTPILFTLKLSTEIGINLIYVKFNTSGVTGTTGYDVYALVLALASISNNGSMKAINYLSKIFLHFYYYLPININLNP